MMLLTSASGLTRGRVVCFHGVGYWVFSRIYSEKKSKHKATTHALYTAISNNQNHHTTLKALENNNNKITVKTIRIRHFQIL
jgi:hypothetical protein